MLCIYHNNINLISIKCDSSFLPRRICCHIHTCHHYYYYTYVNLKSQAPFTRHTYYIMPLLFFGNNIHICTLSRAFTFLGVRNFGIL